MIISPFRQERPQVVTGLLGLAIGTTFLVALRPPPPSAIATAAMLVLVGVVLILAVFIKDRRAPTTSFAADEVIKQLEPVVDPPTVEPLVVEPLVVEPIALATDLPAIPLGTPPSTTEPLGRCADPDNKGEQAAVRCEKCIRSPRWVCLGHAHIVGGIVLCRDCRLPTEDDIHHDRRPR